MAKISRVTPRRGDVVLVDFDPTVGAEIQKTRPAVVIQNDIGNTHSPITIVAAITSYDEGDRVYPTQVLVQAGEGGLTVDSLVLLSQIRSVDQARIKKKIGNLGDETMVNVGRSLIISLGLIEI